MNNIDLVVQQLRTVAAQAGSGPVPGVTGATASPDFASVFNAALLDQSAVNAAATEVGGPEFTNLLKSAVDEVNSTQMDARQLSQQFEAGNADVDLQDVVFSLQKASLSFQTMVQVRNKLVSAYQEIMNMQV
ncbi:MAG: flagellar hook-basal body complex protein FliE [Betaproteobacteria bacterium]|nr:flagellar hook-basal body complex protein FliE [Betaproteobacteria bacterium]